MAKYVEIYEQGISQNYFPDNTFAAQSVDMSKSVKGGNTIHKHVPGTNANVERNRALGTANVAKKEDGFVTFNLTEYTTDPEVIEEEELLFLPYDKTSSVLENHTKSIKTATYNDLLDAWVGNRKKDNVATALPAGNIFQTTGSSNGASVSPKKMLTLANIHAVLEEMDANDVPQEGRIMVIDARLRRDLLKIDQLIQANTFGSPVLPNGVLGTLLGMNIYVRSYVPRYDTTSGTPVLQAPDATLTAAQKSYSCIIYQKDDVARALGTVKYFENRGDAKLYGDVYSALVYAGGVRLMDRGVYVITQDEV